MSSIQRPLNGLIVGASGYTGAELAAYLQRHPHITIAGLTVSAQSVDGGKLLSDIHPRLKGVVDLPLIASDDSAALADLADVVFLATDHAVSHLLAPKFLAAGCTVFDLSGAYRLRCSKVYPQYYGFTHQHSEWLEQAVYGLAEWQSVALRAAQLIALPGCYPTAALLALKPLLDAGLIDTAQWPVINAVSGVSGAGRKASLGSSFCEVSLQPYGLFTHRHQPEIATHLGIPVIFTPHLGNFPRGILETIHLRVKRGVDAAEVATAFYRAYQDKPLIRLCQGTLPSIGAVAGTPFCDIGFSLQGQHLIVVAAEDNLLKGAAAQAVQCMNLRFGFHETCALL
ncbi:N-acetyl-gamma-glutamyl-phosphate reductase [Edwardsiella piscicida]|uniref:N-acetyl-gamma-glutamyl-phosphate reductase n=1 Tax=Edwardsiella piscicida TaxID=1263550 RepID=UPI00054CC070|nr:N-acetyl-gamma-glutamyl-phosphate reductase [Edwardsiella piscicida]